MVTLNTSVVVPEDRRITLTLPPDTPVGAADVQVTVQPAAGISPLLPEEKFDREWKAFHEMLPELLQKYIRLRHHSVGLRNTVGQDSGAGLAVALPAPSIQLRSASFTPGWSRGVSRNQL